MSINTSQNTDAQPVREDDEIGAEIATLRSELIELRDEVDSLRAENDSLRSQVSGLQKELSEVRAELDEADTEREANHNLTTKAHERIRELEEKKLPVSDTTELEIVLQQCSDGIPADLSVAEKRALVMASYVKGCSGPKGVRISNDTFTRKVEHELDSSLAWAQFDRAAEKLSSMAGDAIGYVRDSSGNRLVVNDESVLP